MAQSERDKLKARAINQLVYSFDANTELHNQKELEQFLTNFSQESEKFGNKYVPRVPEDF